MPRANTNSKSAYNRRYQAEHKATLAAQGLCLDCGKVKTGPSPRNPEKPAVRCEKCAKKARKASKAFADRRRPGWKSLGICVTCGKNLSIKATTPGATDTRCAACADYQDDYRAENRDLANKYR